MKRVWIFACMVVMALPAIAQNQPQQPSLGDAARAARANKKPSSTKMRFDNDNLPRSGELSVVGTASEAPKKEPAKEASAADKGADKGEALAKQVEDKKKQISGLEKEIDLLQREHKLKQTMAYVDIGTKLRDQKKWDDDEKKFNSDVADRQKKLDDAQKQLGSLEAAQRAAASGQ